MHIIMFIASALATLLSCVAAETIVITVGGNSANDPSTIFRPRSVVAAPGDIVLFNFTGGNHTATQSTFGSPCVPAHLTNSTTNGFDSSFRDTVNGTAITTLPVTIAEPIGPIWFFDYNTCAQGGVGAINVNETSGETLEGFARNAIRLNGTDSSTGNTSDNGNDSSSGQGDATATSGDAEPSISWAERLNPGASLGSTTWNIPIVLATALMAIAVVKM